jgi:hypothetical protein
MDYRKIVMMVAALAIAVFITGAVIILPKMDAVKSDSSPANHSAFDHPDKSGGKILYGAIHTPFANFRITSDLNRDSYPVIFEEDDKMGFKDQNGKIIVPPIYSKANNFWKGVASVRIDQDGQYVWKSVDVNGKVYDYDEVYGFEFGLSPVSRNGKFGFINTASELVVPLIYDQLFCSYTDDGRSTYALKDGRFVYLDLRNGYEERFEKYDPAQKSEYKRTIDLNDYNLAVANNMLIVNGIAQPSALNFPIPILEGLDFDLYTRQEKLGTYKAKLIPGFYEGEIFVSFPDYMGTPLNETEYYAVLSNCHISNGKVVQLTADENMVSAARHYLRANNIENTTFVVDMAFAGDLNGNGIRGAVLQINDTYRKKDIPAPFEEKWTPRQFTENHTSFVNAILLIADISKPLEYKVVKSNIWNYTDWDYKTENIGFVANLDADSRMELLIYNDYYEYRDYAVADL